MIVQVCHLMRKLWRTDKHGLGWHTTKLLLMLLSHGKAGVCVSHLWVVLQVVQSSCHARTRKHEGAIPKLVHASALGRALMALPFLQSDVKGMRPLLSS